MEACTVGATRNNDIDPKQLLLLFPRPPSSGRRPPLTPLLVSCLFLASLIAVIVHNGLKTASPSPDVAATVTKEETRAREQGVSEKRFWVGSGHGNGSFEWTANMLAWQRTAYHFQPHKNWMNDPDGDGAGSGGLWHWADLKLVALGNPNFNPKVPYMKNREWMYDRLFPGGGGWKQEFLDGVEVFLTYATSQVFRCPCLQKYFCWTVAYARMRKVFLYQAGRRLSNVLKPYFKNGNQPFFVKDTYWKTMLENKATPAAVRRSEVNRANRNSKRSLENGNYYGGSRKVAKWMKVMEKEKGARPLISELVTKLWSKDKKGTDLGTTTAAAVADFEEFIAELPLSAPISVNKQIELWLRATKGLRNGRIPQLGELGASLVRSGLIDDLSDVTSSSMHPQEYLEPLKEEIMEVRDEMKALQAQNKELKDMLALIVQKVGGASTSQ